MAVPALRQSLENAASFGQASNAGLVLCRYLRKADDPEARADLLQAAIKSSTRARSIYSEAFERWKRTLDSDPCTQTQTVSTQGRVIIGLGGQSVLETGIALHQTYGFPYLPGSALKGLAAHYCDQVYGAQEPGFQKREVEGEDQDEALIEKRLEPTTYHRVIFGTQGEAGHIVFHDAWLDPSSIPRPEAEDERRDPSENRGLRKDVMTPHHSAYYRKADEADKPDGSAEIPPPSDFDDPRPVSYLSVSGEFLLAVSCDDDSPRGQAWLNLAMQLLREALENWGIGGKTSSGYGRLEGSQSHPRYDRGDGPIRVVRELDHKKRTKYRADDGHMGHIPGDQPEGKPGDSYEVWVVACADHGYTFSLKEVKAKKSKKRRL